MTGVLTKAECVPGRGSLFGRIAAAVFLAVLSASVSPAAGTAEVRVVADTLSIHADRVPLQDILSKLQDAGIRVRIDPRVNPEITMDFENRDLRSALERLLADCDYALFSTLVDGPAGALRRISEINVYMRGDRREIRPLPGANENLVQVQAPLRSNVIACVKNEVLIRLRGDVSADAFRALLAEINGTVVESIPALGLYRVRLVPGSDIRKVLAALAASSEVERAEPNLVYRPVSPARVDGGKAPAAGMRTRVGSGTAAIAVLDTGLLPGTALTNRVLASLDALAPDRPLADAVGHGTQMALIASGMSVPEGAESAGSFDAPIIPIRAFDDNGYASGFALMRSLTFALDHGARVISMSWGSDTDSAFLNDAMAYAAEQGAVLVAAAGNEPTGRPVYPAANARVVAVAALAPDGSVWTQSNYGSFVTVAAPAFASLPVGYKGPPGSYAGTSVAAAFTANVLARYFTLYPNATAEQAVAALSQCATRVSASGTNSHPEIARLDAAAIAKLLKP